MGREDVLAELRERLTNRGRAALSGLGGIGKTQTAVEYAHRYCGEYEVVLWLNAESLSHMKDVYSELAQQMQLPHDGDDLEQAARDVKRWLETNHNWLLVLDNADDPVMLKPYLPATEHGHIILTSRAYDFQDLGIFRPVELRELSVEDATCFLLRRCIRLDAEAEERTAAEQLARDLGGFPLALEQAAAFVFETGVTFQRYSASYRVRGQARLNARSPALGQYPRTLATTWATNFEVVEKESPASSDILRFSAFLYPDFIPYELLFLGATELGPRVQGALTEKLDDPLLIHDLVRPLSRFSLIRMNGHDETYSIHRMVQEVIKDEMDNTTRRLWATRTLHAILKATRNHQGRSIMVIEAILRNIVIAVDIIKDCNLERTTAFEFVVHSSKLVRLCELGKWNIGRSIAYAAFFRSLYIFRSLYFLDFEFSPEDFQGVPEDEQHELRRLSEAFGPWLIPPSS